MPVQRLTLYGATYRLTVCPPPWPDALAAFRRFCASAPGGILGFDVETTAIEGGKNKVHAAFDPNARLRMVQFGSYTAAWALDVSDEFWRAAAAEALRTEALRFVSHTNYDPLWAARALDVELAERSIDTYPLACLLYPGERADRTLKGLTERLLDAGLREAEQALHARFKELAPTGQRAGTVAPARWGFTNIPLDDPVFARYGGLDAIYVRRLLDVLARRARHPGHGGARSVRLAQREQRIARMATAMQVRGHRLDVEYTAGLLAEVDAEYLTAEKRLTELFGFSPRSPKRGDWLVERGVKFTAATETGRPKLDKKTLPGLVRKYAAHEVGPVLADLLVLSERQNLRNNLRTMLSAIDAHGHVHPTIKTQAAVTGRMSVTGVPMQTFKKTDHRLRNCFLAEPGYVLVRADYDSQEIRLAAAFSRDKLLLRIVEGGLNQHDETAKSIFGPDFTPEQRHAAKTLNFAQQYGAGPRTIAANLGIGLGEAKVLWASWRAAYAGLVAWSERMARLPVVVNPWGRHIPRDEWRYYANGNYMIQSSGRDVLGVAMCRLADAGWAGALWLPVHDELILQVPEAEAAEAVEALSTAMYTVVEGIPLTTTPEIVGARWGGG